MSEASEKYAHEARELVTYIRTSSETMYRVQLALEMQIKAKRCKPEKIREVFRQLIDDGAREYEREYSKADAYGFTFPEGARKLAAEEMAQDYLSGIRRDG